MKSGNSGNLLLALSILVAQGCAEARYTVERDSKLSPAALTGDPVFVAWLPLDAGQYAVYGYDSMDDYTNAIANVNGELRKGLETDHPERRFVFANGTAVAPPGVPIAVYFEKATIVPGQSGVKSAMTLKTLVRFFDASTGQEIRRSRVSASTSGVSSFATYNFEFCLEYAAYNLGRFVGDVLSGSR
jgi:hypothetical protein